MTHTMMVMQQIRSDHPGNAARKPPGKHSLLKSASASPRMWTIPTVKRTAVEPNVHAATINLKSMSFRLASHAGVMNPRMDTANMTKILMMDIVWSYSTCSRPQSLAKRGDTMDAMTSTVNPFISPFVLFVHFRVDASDAKLLRRCGDASPRWCRSFRRNVAMIPAFSRHRVDRRVEPVERSSPRIRRPPKCCIPIGPGSAEGAPLEKKCRHWLRRGGNPGTESNLNDSQQASEKTSDTARICGSNTRMRSERDVTANAVEQCGRVLPSLRRKSNEQQSKGG
mmetsp:Transcript_5209/g.32705  ORF Transcript_5209/g.32705 Transcript_5209/m.32705 type:complete len:282 (+) Transcript_5209:2379-3224(+)